MKILYYPKFDGKNYSVKIFEDCLRCAGFDVAILSKNIIKILFTKSDFAYLQWFENLPSDKPKMFANIIFKIIILYIFKLKNIKVIFVMHNKVAHDKEVATYSCFMLKFILKRAYKIAILCDTTKTEIMKIVGTYNYKKNNYEAKVFKIPHPNYIDVYPKSQNTTFHKIHKNIKEDFTFIFMGMIRPYKNVDVVIKAFKEANLQNCRLVVIGKPHPIEYGNRIKELAGNDERINIISKFIDDSEMDGIISKADVIVLPYDKRSSLNSGVAYLAFSYAKTIISPPTGTVMEFKDYKDCMYIYDYHDTDDHIKQLINKFKQAYNDWKQDKQNFTEKGKKLFSVVKEQNSRRALTAAYRHNIP